MMNKNQLIGVIGFCLAFICLGFGDGGVWATQAWDGDTVELAVDYSTAYPGHFPKINVLIKNPVPIHSFKIYFTLGGWDLINFHTVRIYVDSVAIAPVDTCPSPDTLCTVDTCYCGQGEPDTCECWIYDRFPVRECLIDTVGSLISGFEVVTCHGDTGDTSLLDCKSVTVYGRARSGAPIPARGDFGLLFKLGVDMFCLCDMDTGRGVYFLVSPGFSNFSDELGTSVPFKYLLDGYEDLTAWWSVPGDVSNDSLVNSADIVSLINYLFLPTHPAPCIMETADPDSSCLANSGDIVYMINYLYKGGLVPPKRGCYCPEGQTIRRINGDFEPTENSNRKPLLERR